MVHFIAESDLSLNDVHFFVPTSSSRSRDHTMHCLLDIRVKIVLKVHLKLWYTIAFLPNSSRLRLVFSTNTELLSPTELLSTSELS